MVEKTSNREALLLSRDAEFNAETAVADAWRQRMNELKRIPNELLRQDVFEGTHPISLQRAPETVEICIRNVECRTYRAFFLFITSVLVSSALPL